MALLAARVRAAHAARVWQALGYDSRGDHAVGELDLSRRTPTGWSPWRRRRALTTAGHWPSTR